MFSSQHNIHGQIQNATLASACLCNKNKFYNHIKNKRQEDQKRFAVQNSQQTRT